MNYFFIFYSIFSFYYYFCNCTGGGLSASDLFGLRIDLLYLFTFIIIRNVLYAESVNKG